MDIDLRLGRIMVERGLEGPEELTAADVKAVIAEWIATRPVPNSEAIRKGRRHARKMVSSRRYRAEHFMLGYDGADEAEAEEERRWRERGPEMRLPWQNRRGRRAESAEPNQPRTFTVEHRRLLPKPAKPAPAPKPKRGAIRQSRRIEGGPRLRSGRWANHRQRDDDEDCPCRATMVRSRHEKAPIPKRRRSLARLSDRPWLRAICSTPGMSDFQRDALGPPTGLPRARNQAFHWAEDLGEKMTRRATPKLSVVPLRLAREAGLRRWIRACRTSVWERLPRSSISATARGNSRLSGPAVRSIVPNVAALRSMPTAR